MATPDTRNYLEEKIMRDPGPPWKESLWLDFLKGRNYSGNVLIEGAAYDAFRNGYIVGLKSSQIDVGEFDGDDEN